MKKILLLFVLLLTSILNAQDKHIVLGIHKTQNSGMAVSLTYPLFAYKIFDIGASFQYSQDLYVHEYISLKVNDEIRNKQRNHYTNHSLGLGISGKYLMREYIPGIYINSNLFLNSHKVIFRAEETVLLKMHSVQYSDSKWVWDAYFNLEVGYQFNIGNFMLQTGWLYGNGLYIADYLVEIPSETSSIKIGIGYIF